MVAKYNRLSFVYGVPGIALQIAAYVMPAFTQGGAILAFLLLTGTILLMIGLAYYAKAKGQSWAWCVAGFLSILGLLLLLLLPDKTESPRGAGVTHEKA